MNISILQHIQQLQFSDPHEASKLLKSFISDTFQLDVLTVELRPLVVSLNSFNGFLGLSDGRRLFFKTHTESDNVIGEYYNVSQLANAGYPIIQPLMVSTEAGKQLLIYDVVNDPSVFDIAWQIECGESQSFNALSTAQYEADTQLLKIYLDTLEFQDAEDATRSPIHQLFYHRLTGGRLSRFYGSVPNDDNAVSVISLPGKQYKMNQVREVRWRINGQEYDITLNQLIVRATNLLQPRQSNPSVIGHGDAHNGNVFFRLNDKPPSLLYFDPAFAGRHNPLLDIVKPLFHNVFAMWMYFPYIKAHELDITVHREDNIWSIDHNYHLHPIREMFLQSKLRVLMLLLRELQLQRQLRPDWRVYLKAALFCCPLLTMNLADNTKFSPEISLLGLSMAIEMGAESIGKRSLIDQLLDEVAENVS